MNLLGGRLRIDFDALSRLLLELQTQARRNGLVIERVILAPEYVPLLLGSADGGRLGPIEPVLTRKPVRVRHDEHVHVDFGVAP
jgi:penicillin-insensitive murein endopeptidase